MGEQRSTSVAAKAERTVVESWDTEEEAWDNASRFAKMLKDRGLADQMGVTVKKARGVFWVILVKRI